MADQATSRHQPVVIRPWRSSMLQPDAYVRSGSGADKPPLGQGGGVQRVPSVESGSGQRLAGAGTPGVRSHRMTPNGVGVSAPFPLIHATPPLGLEGLLTNLGTLEGKDGGEANPTELHEGVQGVGSEAAARYLSTWLFCPQARN